MNLAQNKDNRGRRGFRADLKACRDGKVSKLGSRKLKSEVIKETGERLNASEGAGKLHGNSITGARMAYGKSFRRGLY